MNEETKINQLTVSPEEFAELTGYDLATVYRYVNLGMPCSHREVQLKQATQWLLNFQGSTENSEKFGQQKKAQIPLCEIAFQESPKEKICGETMVVDAIQQSVSEIKNRLIALPSKLNPVSPHTVENSLSRGWWLGLAIVLLATFALKFTMLVWSFEIHVHFLCLLSRIYCVLLF